MESTNLHKQKIIISNKRVREGSLPARVVLKLLFLSKSALSFEEKTMKNTLFSETKLVIINSKKIGYALVFRRKPIDSNLFSKLDNFLKGFLKKLIFKQIFLENKLVIIN